MVNINIILGLKPALGLTLAQLDESKLRYGNGTGIALNTYQYLP